MDVRYLATVPKVGDLVTHAGALWVVSRVDVDAQGVMVTCGFPELGARPASGSRPEHRLKLPFTPSPARLRFRPAERRLDSRGIREV